MTVPKTKNREAVVPDARNHAARPEPLEFTAVRVSKEAQTGPRYSVLPPRGGNLVPDRGETPLGAGSLRVELALRLRNPLNGTHGHWAAKARDRKRQRGAAGLAVRPLVVGLSVDAGVLVVLTRIAPSAGLDDDGLSAACKSVRDGVADALGVDDRDPRVTWAYWQERGRSYGVRVELRARDDRGPA